LNIQSDLYTYKSNAATALNESRLAEVRILAHLGQLANAFSGAAKASVSWGAPETIGGHLSSTNSSPHHHVQALTRSEPESTPLSNLE
jgi:hypothetical protein